MYALKLNEAFDPHRAGGKAAGLAQAMLGMRVPPGFVISQESLKLFLVGADLYWRVHHYLKDIHPQKLDAARRKFSELCASIQAAPMPALIRKEIEPLAVVRPGRRRRCSTRAKWASPCSRSRWQ